MSDQEQVRVAAAAVRSARHAINAATQRRMAAVATAQDLADAAHAAERAERDAARSAAAAGIHLLTAAQLTEPQIAVICQLPPREIRDCRPTTQQAKTHGIRPALPARTSPHRETFSP
ncbi:MAG TPA: hypothetical protein VIU11_03355 [Nakamurella sp.]